MQLLNKQSLFHRNNNSLKTRQVVDSLVNKTLEELRKPPRIHQSSRVWESSVGYKYLIPWSNAVLLRYLIRLQTSSLPKSEYRRKAQVDDASRSVVRNIEEGFKRASTSPYLEFLSFSQGSLEEVKGDVRELTEDGFLPSKPGSSLASIGINLKDFHEALKPKPTRGNLEETKGNLKEFKGTLGDCDQSSNLPLSSSNPPLSSFSNPLNSSNIPSKSSNFPLKTSKDFAYQHLTVLYPPLAKVRSQDLTYEIFTELINKTDYLLRVLVVSLEKKLIQGQKAYQIDRARIKNNLSFK